MDVLGRLEGKKVRVIIGEKKIIVETLDDT